MQKPPTDCYKMRKDTGNTKSYIWILCFPLLWCVNYQGSYREEILSVKFSTVDQILLTLKKYLEIKKILYAYVFWCRLNIREGNSMRINIKNKSFQSWYCSYANYHIKIRESAFLLSFRIWKLHN